MEKAVRLGHEDTAVDTKYGQYQRPIARRILFWLNGDTCTSPDGLRHPSDRSGSKL
jgi:hypothetical protein